jgi:hypothetical protein
MSAQSEQVSRTLRLMGMTGTAGLKPPSILPEGYDELWKSFLSTTSMRTLREKPDSHYLIGLSFFSFLQRTDKRVVPPSIEFPRHNVHYNKDLLANTWSNIREKVSSSRLSAEATLLKHTYRITGNDNTFLGALTQTQIEGYLIYKPRSQAFESLLDSQKKLLFRADIPKYLYRKGTLSLTKAKTVKSHPWYDLVKAGRYDYSLSVLRSKENYLVLRYTVTLPCIYFYGNSQNQKTAMKHRDASWKLISKV